MMPSVSSSHFVQLHSSLDRDKTPPPYPAVNLHIDEVEASEAAIQLAEEMRVERLRQKQVEGDASRKRNTFEKLMDHKQRRIELLADLGEHIRSRPSQSQV